VMTVYELVPRAPAIVEQRQASDVVGTVYFEAGQLVVRLTPAAARSAGVPELDVEPTGDEFGPFSSPLHPRNGYVGPMRWVPPDDPRRVELDVRKYLATPWWLRWAHRWLP
jgi:hypothetical protein